VLAPQVDVGAFRQGWLIATRLAGLFEAECIDREALDAACAWRRWSELSVPYRVQQWEARVDTSLAPSDSGMLKRVTAAEKLREAADALGALRIKLLEQVVLRDLPWVEIARLLRVSDKTARARAAEALEALADWRAGRTVAAPPKIRYRIEPGRQ
jgi:DNA-directed RNA polymerase specialized sigma24 family protein